MVTKDLVWAMVVLTRRTKELADLKSEVVNVRLQIKGNECDPEDVLETQMFWKPNLDLRTRATILNSIQAESEGQ